MSSTSTSSPESTPFPESSLNYDQIVKQEFDHLSKVHPQYKDIPTCMSLLGLYLSCNGFKNHMRSIYRDGEMAKFCMKMKFKTEEERREAWLLHRAKWWATRRTTGSSEDVWDIRTKPLDNYPGPPRTFTFDWDSKDFVALPDTKPS
ncbi:SubName: Full=Uncharacterized protein {ECO:0000313/EMBL:CCA75939.1} [Serendipita indica DSM 11827]|nr:SubName: Full=Uncharacterized protein {ECO:0000313/EMBL:CCA75939.1} [Serendipita indica DSM 11827]